MRQLDRLYQLKGEIQRISKKHNALRLYVFGSCARKEETSESDVDFLADFNPKASLFDQVGLELELAELLGRDVDVVSLRRLEADDAFTRSAKEEMLELC